MQGTSWSQESKLSAGGLAALFGIAIDLDGTLAAIGGIGQAGRGRGWLARRSGTTWTLGSSFVPVGIATGDGFAGALALDGGALIAGAAQEDDAGASSGAAHVFAVRGDFADFCSGDGGDQLGCTPCPCSNTAPEGTVAGCLHGLGRSARLFATGSASVTADSLRFEVQDARPITFAVLTSGDARAPANMANPCFALASGLQAATLDGLRCVVQNVQRHGTRPSNANGDVGTTTAGWGPPSGPAGGLALQGGFASGQTRHFQAIYRVTPTENCGRAQNTTQGVTVIFAP